MASGLGLQLQATFAFGARQRWSRVVLRPAPASNDPLKKACVLRSTPRLSRGRVRSSWACGPPEGPSVERKVITVIRKAAGLQALALAAACAAGAASLCLSRRVAAMPDPRAAVTAAAPIAGEVREVKVRTDIFLRKIMFGRKEQCEDACKKLLGHAFGLLPLDTQRRLLEQTISLDKIRDKIRDANIGSEEKYEMQIAIVQIHIAMHGYQEAKVILESMDASETDARIPLLQAILNMMLALEKKLKGATADDEEVKKLINSAKESWKKYEEGFGINRPPSTDSEYESSKENFL